MTRTMEKAAQKRQKVCNKVKALFHHGVNCQVRVTGGCQTCKRMWALLHLHARQCQSAQCPFAHLLHSFGVVRWVILSALQRTKKTQEQHRTSC